MTLPCDVEPITPVIPLHSPSSHSLWINYRAAQRGLSAEAREFGAGMVEWFARHNPSPEIKGMARVMQKHLKRKQETQPCR
jgi:hypothetical protein